MAKLLVLFIFPLYAYHLTIFVDARDLNYTSSKTLWRSLHAQEDPSFGHAWIRLEHDDYLLEGGHTGEFGNLQPRYLEGVLLYKKQRDPNPIRYLWETQKDGCFQVGSGGHTATHQMEIPLTQVQFETIRKFIEGGHYPFHEYNLTRHQCTSFVVQVASLAGIILKSTVTVPVERRLWRDPAYSKITLSSPDLLVQNSPFLRASVYEKEEETNTTDLQCQCVLRP